MMIKLAMSLLILFQFLLGGVNGAICSAKCTQIWDSGSYSNSAACSAATTCTICETSYYRLSAVSGDCVPTGIYNFTVPVGTTSGDVAPTGGASVGINFGGGGVTNDCVNIDGVGTATFTASVATQ